MRFTYNREIIQRMSKQLAWLLSVAVLVSIGLLMACGSSYNKSSDGLVVVTSQGSALLETFSFGLNSGSMTAVNNPPANTGTLTQCVLNGIPSAIVVDPAGAYAYTIINASPSVCGSSSATGIGVFKINSDGTLAANGTLTADPNPVALVMNTTGKYLFVAEGLNSMPGLSPPPRGFSNAPCPGTTQQFGICVYSISGGALTPVPGAFTLALPAGQGFQPPNFAAIAVTPMTLPPLLNGQQIAACSSSSQGNNPPKSEFLYASDTVNSVVWEFSVNTSTGALGNPPNRSQVPYFPSPSAPQTGLPLSVPAGIAVDACDRFVYVSNNLANNISAYSICSGMPTQSSQYCPQAPNPSDGSLVAVSGSPFANAGNTTDPGPMVVDPFGNTLYVLNGSTQTFGQISIFRIATISGSLTPGTPATAATGQGPTSLAIRSDDSWLFVANFASGTLSQYSITPSSGALNALPVTTTDNWPSGVAVK